MIRVCNEAWECPRIVTEKNDMKTKKEILMMMMMERRGGGEEGQVEHDVAINCKAICRNLGKYKVNARVTLVSYHALTIHD